MQKPFTYQERFHRLRELVRIYVEEERALTEKCLYFVDQDDFQGIKELLIQKQQISARTRALQRFLAFYSAEADAHA